MASNDAILERGNAGPKWRGRREILGRLARLAAKELRETLRDRRTIVTLFVMPLLLYPLLALVFQRFLLTSLPMEGTVEYVIGVDSERTWRRLSRQIAEGDRVLRQQEASEPHAAEAEEPLSGFSRFALLSAGGANEVQPVLVPVELPRDGTQRQVIDAAVHLAVLPRRDSAVQNGDGLGRPTVWDLYYREGSPTSEAALRFVDSRLRAYNEAHLDQQLKNLGVSAFLPGPTAVHALDFSGAPVFSLAALIPLILVLMTVTGAVYPAIDLTAGERERGTLEMLIAAPVPRMGLLLAKYVAVLAVALLTATVNLAGMAITVHSTGLNLSLFGGAGLSWSVVVKVLALLALFAAFFSAVLLAITSYARSFKEAQAYIIPLMLLCLVPGIICLMPSLQFTGLLAVVPLVNIVLLARDLLEGSVEPALATAAVASTALYVGAAIALAARVFGTDAVLYGSQSTWSDIFRRPSVPSEAASLPAAAAALAIMFPCYFVLSSQLARSAELSMEGRLLIAALVTALVFGAIPWAIARFNRVALRSGMALRPASAGGWLAAVVLGLVLWPLAHELVLASQWLGLASLRAEQIEQVQGFIALWKEVSPLWILLAMAVMPGVFEELFFRGFWYSSLRRVSTPWRTIVASAALFGLFHVVAATALAPERFLPSFFLGLALGWLRHRTESVLPCMLLHVLHNGVLISIVYWRDELAARGWGVDEAAHLPLGWLAIAGVVGAAALLGLQVVSRTTAQGA